MSIPGCFFQQGRRETCGHHGLGKGFGLAGVDDVSVKLRFTVMGGCVEVLQWGDEHRSGQNLLLISDGHGVAPPGKAMEIIDRPVDGVDDPLPIILFMGD